MRHVTDGELHAYLDGALDALPQGRGDEVREHLASCAACRERLEDERGVLDAARDLLERTAPPEEALPPFEELRSRAEALEAPGGREDGSDEPLAYRGPIRGMHLAWAATVVLALGVGWMGGEIWRAMPGDSPLETRSPPTMARPAASDDAGDAGARAGDRTNDPTERPRQDVEGSAARGGDPAGSAPGTLPEETTGPGEARREVAEEDAPAPPSPSFPDSRSKAGAQGDPAGELERARIPASSPEGVVRAGAEGAEETDFSIDRATADLMDPERLARENSLSVPGLKVLSVEWEEWVPGERNLHIRQLLSMGDTLELRYLGLLMGTDPEPLGERMEGVSGRRLAADLPPLPKAMEASLPPGWNQVVVRRGRGWLVARAQLPEPSLRALVRSLH